MRKNTISQIILLLCLLLILLASACSGAANLATAPTATPNQVHSELDMKAIVRDFLANLPEDMYQTTSQDVVKMKPFIVDVRQPDEYRQGFVEGAVNIPLRELAKNLQSLPGMDKDIVLICDSGHRSAIGMAVLQMLGFKKAKSLAHGMSSWQAANLPVVAAPVPRQPEGQAPKVNTQLQAMLDYYLVFTLPNDWGIIDPGGLTEDQKRKSSAELEILPETYDQGPSLLMDVDEPEEFAKANLNPTKSINAPLKALPDSLDNMPLQETINWF